MATADEVRSQQRETWDRFSDGWTKWDDLVLTMIEPVGAEMIRSLDLREDAEHLDVAAGTGEPGLTIAALVPRGRVVVTDLAAGMLTTARARAAARGLDNVEVRECSVDDLPFDDASFDSITCRFGFMFFPDLVAAIDELVRVLRPGGKIAAAVWAEPPGNAWATIPMGAIAAQVDLPRPDPDAPGLFRFAAPDAIGSAFRAAGMRDVAETDVTATLDPESLEEYWAFMTEIAAPVVGALSTVDDATRERIRVATLEQARAFVIDGRPRLPLHARCIVGTKAG